MATIVKIEFSPSQILTTRGLQTNGSAQRFFTGELRRKMDPYVPFLNGPLKNTAIENEDSVQYITPYAQRQYHENKGKDCVEKNGISGVGQITEIRSFSLLQIM